MEIPLLPLPPPFQIGAQFVDQVGPGLTGNPLPLPAKYRVKGVHSQPNIFLNIFNPHLVECKDMECTDVEERLGYVCTYLHMCACARCYTHVCDDK